MGIAFAVLSLSSCSSYSDPSASPRNGSERSSFGLGGFTRLRVPASILCFRLSMLWPR